ncbi:MAG: helix-turn-helix transcriptional regulator [Gemmatimonadaceae bacterium]
MPHKDKKSTLMRQWDMLKLLPSASGGPWMKASEIASRLEDDGHEISVRTVQRDLKELSMVFPIELNDKNPRDYGWRWMKGAHLAIPGLSLPEALAMRLVELHLKQLMPSSMLEALQGVFGYAKSKLDASEAGSNHGTSDWLKKVKVVQPNQPLLPPKLERAAQEAICNALLKNRKVRASYKPIWQEASKEYVLNPLGLVMRGPVSYLVATAWDYEDVRLYAMHRFEQAEVLDEEFLIPDGFELEKTVSSGFADFLNGEPIRLQFLCDETNAAHLSETPLSEDQEIVQEKEGWTRISATVNDTWQLRWWLLSKGSGVEVLSPENLRNEISGELRQALSNYGMI